jgi:hypothetical protein
MVDLSPDWPVRAAVCAAMGPVTFANATTNAHNETSALLVMVSIPARLPIQFKSPAVRVLPATRTPMS